MLFSIDPLFCNAQSLARRGGTMRVDDYFVAADPFVRNLGTTCAVAFRQGRFPPAVFLEPLARELAYHVAMTYSRQLRKGRGQGLSAARLARVMQAMEESMGRGVTTSQLAALVHLSEFHFSRMFRVSTGHAPHGYLTLQRMELARQLLEDAARPLREVSEAVGYRTQAHFTSVFHAYCGMTPAQYRRAHRLAKATSFDAPSARSPAWRP